MKTNLKSLIAVAALSIGIGAATVPAQADYTGLGVYTQSEPSRFAPEGLPRNNSADFRATIDIEPDNSARDAGPVTSERLNDRLDREHSAW